MNNGMLSLLGAGAVGAIVVAIIGAIAGRKKLGAEATKIITDAASGVVANIERDNERLRKSEQRKAAKIADLERRLDDIEEERDDWERERVEWRSLLEKHDRWDVMFIARVREIDPTLDIPDPPPLTPPSRPRRTT